MRLVFEENMEIVEKCMRSRLVCIVFRKRIWVCDIYIILHVW
jgi:hypothetical protein